MRTINKIKDDYRYPDAIVDQFGICSKKGFNDIDSRYKCNRRDFNGKDPIIHYRYVKDLREYSYCFSKIFYDDELTDDVNKVTCYECIRNLTLLKMINQINFYLRYSDVLDKNYGINIFLENFNHQFYSHDSGLTIEFEDMDIIISSSELIYSLPEEDYSMLYNIEEGTSIKIPEFDGECEYIEFVITCIKYIINYQSSVKDPIFNQDDLIKLRDHLSLFSKYINYIAIPLYSN